MMQIEANAIKNYQNKVGDLKNKRYKTEHKVCGTGQLIKSGNCN